MRMKQVIAGLFSFALLSIATGAGAADYTIKLAHNGPEAHPFQDGAVAFKEHLEASSNGAIEVQIFPGEQLGSEEETSQMLKQGTLQCAVESAGGGLAPFVPEADLFNLPFIFSDIDHFYRVVDGPIGESVAEKVEMALDSEVLGWWFSGIRNAWNDTRPIMTPDDMKGLKIRVMGSPVLIDTFNALGAQATPMSFGEVYTSLQQGVIDGAETDHVDLLVENFFEVTKYVSLTGHMYLAAALVCGNKALSQLPEDLQSQVREAGAVATQAEREAMDKMAGEALAMLKEKGLEFNEVDNALFREAVSSVYANNADRVGGMDVIDQVAAQ
ncbi:MAG: TRAP transporter substrate-binding protein [Gammaproteobacteria bacterium]|nr:TRAP transporter substrate-binding protein [Gammaproteobacteria bacterium]